MSEPKTTQQFNIGLTGQINLPEIRQHIEVVKDAVTSSSHLVRFMLEDLMVAGDCYVHLPNKIVIPMVNLVWRDDHYEYLMNGEVFASIPAEDILHLRRVVP